MKRLAIIVAVVFLLGWVGLTACTAYKGTVRYRLTVNVETPDGIATGSGVIEYKHTVYKRPLPMTQGTIEETDRRGEAVVVDLGTRGTLYVLLACRQGKTPVWCSGDKLPFEVLKKSGSVDLKFQPGETDGAWRARMARAIEAMRGKHPVAIADLPFLVRFRDERDPKTVEAVDPYNLAASFGEGVRLGSVTMEITDDPVTRGIEKRLGWLGDPSILENPGWAKLPSLAQSAVMGLRRPIP